MDLKNKLMIAFAATLCLPVYSQELPEVASRQNFNEIRYVSSDGKTTLFQNFNGALMYATNYKVHKLLESGVPGNTEYSAIATPTKKMILIAEDTTKHNYLSARKNLNLYKLKFGETKPLPIGKGVAPRLHLDDEFISFYDMQTKILTIRKSNDSMKEYKIHIQNPVNPYFIPEVVMPKKNIVLYTDLNKRGFAGVLSYNLDENKITPIIKANTQLETIELCQSPTNIFIGSFGIQNSKVGSAISMYNYRKQNIEDREVLYSSDFNDIGNMKCQNEKLLFFIKSNEQNLKTVSRFNLVTRKNDQLTKPDSIIQLVEMDQKVYLEYLGKYFIVHGENNLGKDTWEK